jgi:AcrR family transcriptional regulator
MLVSTYIAEVQTMATKDETREKLLQATLELVSEKGYLGATTREIAALAGVSELTLFRKFGKKEQLFEEMLESFTFLPQLRDLIADIDDMPVQEGLSVIGTRFLETLRDRRQLVQILFSEMSHYPEKVRRIYQTMIYNMARTLENYLETRKPRGEIQNLDMDFASFAFLRVLFMTFTYESIIKGGVIDDDRIEYTVNELVSIFLNGIAKGKEG